MTKIKAIAKEFALLQQQKSFLINTVSQASKTKNVSCKPPTSLTYTDLVGNAVDLKGLEGEHRDCTRRNPHLPVY